MIDERAFLAQLESATPDELAQILRRPSADEERLLEIYFGPARLQRLRGLSLTSQRRRGVARGNVVVLHGIMGGEMTVFPTGQASQFIWLNIPRLAIGAAGWLRMTPDLKSQFDVRATGIIKKYYSEQLLGLTSGGWNVQAFWFDWRQDLAVIADVLHEQINRWFGTQAPVNLVAHSMGGLVSRTYILRHRDRWSRGGRLVMLGTPNHGSFAIPQVITGAYDTVRKLALVDLSHNLRDLCAILNGFPGSMQMLPSPLQMPQMERMYKAEQWSQWGVPQRILDVARASHERLAKIVDGDRMSYVAGCNQVTKVGVGNWNRLDHADAYTDSLDGDGTVPHVLGFLRDGSTRIPTYFVECSHGALPNRADVISGTQQILANGKCDLSTSIPKKRAVAATEDLAAAKRARELAEEETLRELSRRVRSRSRAVGDAKETPLSNDEMRAHEILVRSFLAEDSSDETATPAREALSALPVSIQTRTPAQAPPVSIAIGIVLGGIEEINGSTRKADALSVGHYIGVAPQNAELAIDEAISAAIPDATKDKTASRRLLITSLCRRGVIVGELGQNFILPDPRDPRRVIVIAGMGRPGTFREAELAVLTRELAWTLGRSGKKDLATVLIGSGAGNLETQDAVRAWLRGIRRALHDAETANEPRLRSVTFVEFDDANFIRLHRTLETAIDVFAKDPEAPLLIEYTAPDNAVLRRAQKAAERTAARRGVTAVRQSFKSTNEIGPDPEPTRLTIQLQGDTFQFAALTSEASVPERNTQIDPQLVDEANDQLPSAQSFGEQIDHGNLLGRLLLPVDMRELVVRQNVPVVLALDATTARVHWEMLAFQAAGGANDFNAERFLGTSLGVTRQLRTSFAQIPEAPILTSRPFRVLVVADPAEDAPLPGAQEEGEAVAAIFEEFGRHANRDVEVVRLLGPGNASRIAVLDQLVNHRFDLLHFSGHCFYDKEVPQRSGWIFTGRHVLSASELSRIDRVPRFVFSNACESGITPDRANMQSAMLAPSFAEAFFARGVANFICTAWPVDDEAALEFARRFYRGILGLRENGAPAEPVHEAMRAARCDIAQLGLGGMQTWGAYQHYGDPNLRIIPRGTESAPAPVSTRTATARRRQKNAKRRLKARR